MVTPAARRAAAQWLHHERRISERRACRLTRCPRRTKRYNRCVSSPKGFDKPSATLSRAAALRHRRVHWWVRQQGFEAGRHRVRRIYREEGLVGRKRGATPQSGRPRPMTVPTIQMQRWSMDFVHDQLSDGRRFRVFNVVDDFSRQSVACYGATSLLPLRRPGRLSSSSQHGQPQALVCDDGPEFTCLHFLQWAAQHRLDVQYIDPGKPIQNAFCESSTPHPGRMSQRPMV